MTATPGMNGEFGKYRWKISLEHVSTSWINPFMRICFLSDENHQLKQQTHKDHLVDFNQLLLPVWCLHIKFLFAIQFSLQTAPGYSTKYEAVSTGILEILFHHE